MEATGLVIVFLRATMLLRGLRDLEELSGPAVQFVDVNNDGAIEGHGGTNWYGDHGVASSNVVEGTEGLGGTT